MRANNANNVSAVNVRRLEALVPQTLRFLAQEEHRHIQNTAHTYPVVDIFLVSPQEMREIKQEFLIAKQGGKRISRSKIIDVLAFPEPSGFPHPDREGIFLGYIYLNEEIFMDDPDRGIVLFIHGFLHLLGYDHTRKRDTIRMERLEDKLLRELKSF